MRYFPRLFITCLFPLLYSCASRESADRIYTHATIWTGDSSLPLATTIALRDSLILYVGDDASAFQVPETDIIDLEGQMIVPGLIDNHTHFLLGGQLMLNVDLRPARSPREFIAILSEYCRNQPKDAWIRGGFWDNEAWGGELPSRHWVDSVTGQRPLFIYRYDGHMALVNTRALEIAGITGKTQDPAGGRIEKDRQGQPTGILRDEALPLVDQFIPLPDKAERRRYFDTAARHALMHGVTQVTDMGGFGGWPDLETYRDAYPKQWPGIRIQARMPISGWARLDSFIQKEGRGDRMLSWDGVKGYVDGSLGSTTAWFFAPYLDAPQSTGFMVTDSNQLRRWIREADAAGLKINVHAIGDRAVHWLLQSYAQLPGKNHRASIEHNQHLLLEDIPSFSQLGVIASMHPYHAIDDGRWAWKRLDSSRLVGTYAFRKVLSSGAVMSFGSDWPVAPLDPIAGIYAAVTRRTLDDAHPNGWLPEEKLTVEEALRAYTAANAFHTFNEDRLGVLRQGMLADMVVLSENLLTIAPENIRKVNVNRTIVNGRELYRR